MNPLLKNLHESIVGEERAEFIFISAQQEQSRVKIRNEKDSSNNSVLHSFVNDIYQIVKENAFTEEEQEKISLKMYQIITRYLTSLKDVSAEEQKRLERELYKDMAGILLTLKSYEKRKKEYSLYNYLSIHTA